MIVEYYRPERLKDALELITRQNPLTVPLGGGTVLNRPSDEPMAVVDLQTLGLEGTKLSGDTLLIGAMVTLEDFIHIPSLPASLAGSARLEANYNLRQKATLAGTLVTANGRFILTTSLLAMDTSLEIHYLTGGNQEKSEWIGLGNLLPLRKDLLRGRLITQVKIPLKSKLAIESISRTDADLPVLCVAIARWTSSRTRLTVGGFGIAPILAMDGPEATGAEAAAKNACLQAEDEWTSAEYRTDVVVHLVQRCLSTLDEN